MPSRMLAIGEFLISIATDDFPPETSPANQTATEHCPAISPEIPTATVGSPPETSPEIPTATVDSPPETSPAIPTWTVDSPLETSPAIRIATEH